MQIPTVLIPPYPTPGENKVLTKIYPHIQYTTIKDFRLGLYRTPSQELTHDQGRGINT